MIKEQASRKEPGSLNAYPELHCQDASSTATMPPCRHYAAMSPLCRHYAASAAKCRHNAATMPPAMPPCRQVPPCRHYAATVPPSAASCAATMPPCRQCRHAASNAATVPPGPTQCRHNAAVCRQTVLGGHQKSRSTGDWIPLIGRTPNHARGDNMNGSDTHDRRCQAARVGETGRGENEWRTRSARDA